MISLAVALSQNKDLRVQNHIYLLCFPCFLVLVLETKMFHQYVVASAFVIVSFASVVTGELFSNNETTFIAFI